LTTEDIKEKIFSFVGIKPLDFLVSVFEQYEIKDQIIVDCLASYDKFLSLLDEKDKRDHLKKLNMYDAYNDPLFQSVRENSHAFQNSLNKVFLSRDNHLGDFTLNYGIF
jgi:hypothetical protein